MHLSTRIKGSTAATFLFLLVGCRETHVVNANNSVPASEPVTLEYFMHDYVVHLEHHLAQILEPIAPL